MTKINFFVYLFLIALLCACKLKPGEALSPAYPLDPQAVQYSGNASKNVVIQGATGLAVLHIKAKTTSTFHLSIEVGQENVEMLSGSGPLDEFRAFEFSPTSQATLQIQSDQPWSVTISPANPAYFSSLKIPGIYKGTGNAVIFLDGEYGVATFSLKTGQNFTAWGIGPDGISRELAIKPSGDYRGKAVLPQDAAWLIVSTKDAWSVDIQAPCCKVPPWIKPENP